MYHVRARVEINAPIERAFEAVSDHKTFLSSTGSTCRLTREGAPDRNGLGAVREVKVGDLTFLEEIVQFEAPRRFDYVVIRVENKNGRPLPIQHERGWLLFEPSDRGTAVEWHTRFRIPWPIIGWWLERLAGWRIAPQFRRRLLEAKRRLETALDESSTRRRTMP